MNPDPTGGDPTGGDPTGGDAPVTITEIAEFFRQLRALSRPDTVLSATDSPRDTGERAAFLARKADLLARIAAQHPELAPTATTLTATRPDGGRA